MNHQNGQGLSQMSDPKVVEAFEHVQDGRNAFPAISDLRGPSGPTGNVGDPGKPFVTAKTVLRARSASLRAAAAHLDALADMTPEVLSTEQETSLMYLAQNMQLAV